VLPSRQRMSPLPTNQPPVILGSAIPPVSPSLVEKIETGKFIEMGDLVPSHLGLEETLRSKSKQQTITCVSEWLQEFAVYVSVVAK